MKKLMSAWDKVDSEDALKYSMRAVMVLSLKMCLFSDEAGAEINLNLVANSKLVSKQPSRSYLSFCGD